MMPGEPLFLDTEIFDYKKSRKREMKEEIRELTEDQLENSIDSLALIFSQKYGHSPIRLHDFITKGGGEVDKDISGDLSRGVPREKGPVYRKAQRIIVKIPYEGDRKLLKIKPSTYDSNPPRYNELDENYIVHYVDFFEDSDDAEDVNREIDSWVSSVKKYVGNLNSDIEDMNSELENEARSAIARRRESLEGKKEILEKVGVDKKEPQSLGYVKPEKKREIKTTSSDTERGLEVLHRDPFEEILGIIEDIGLNLERSNPTVRSLDEESLRDILLLAINSHYKGFATGETFNRSGKTDIFLRYRDRKIFVAECKFWRGESGYHDAIDQLLENLTVHDSRGAVIVFSRRRNFEEIEEKIEEATKDHENYVTKETEFSDHDVYRFEHPSGPTINIGVKLFDVSS